MEQTFGFYTELYNYNVRMLESGSFFPNMKAIRKQIRDAKKSLDILTQGAEIFSNSLEDVAKAERRIQDAKDKHNAMTALYKYIQNRMKQVEEN